MAEFDPRIEGVLTDEQARALGIDPNREYAAEELMTTEEVLDALGPEVRQKFDELQQRRAEEN